MAEIENPSKEFQFRITLPGLNSFLAQEVNLPEKDIDVVEHGDTNFLVKTGGMVKVGNLMIDKICPSDDTDDFVWDWLESIQSQDSGGGDLPSEYKTEGMVEQLGNDGITTVKAWLLSGCWPHKVNGVKFSRTSSSNTVERIEFCADKFKRI